MSYYGSAKVANTILRRVFDQDVPITVDRLQALLYLLEVRHRVTSDTLLVGEGFAASDGGPRISHIDFQYARSDQDKPIGRFCKDATGQAWLVTRDVDLNRRILNLLRDTEGRATASLIVETTAPGTPWALARTAGERYLNDREITRFARAGVASVS